MHMSPLCIRTGGLKNLTIGGVHALFVFGQVPFFKRKALAKQGDNAFGYRPSICLSVCVCVRIARPSACLFVCVFASFHLVWLLGGPTI